DFGKDYFLELDLYQMAGLSNTEILKTATGNAAKAFNLPIGELSVGSKATFVVLNDSPLEDIANLQNIGEVWKNGKRE
ncbi:MAG: amidohydrolase family protein, partial [Balneola sp.]|nr:amidohydrolase family protein [Balneola sp.]